MQPSVSVCLSVFFFANATYPLGIHGPTGAGSQHYFLSSLSILVFSLKKKRFEENLL